MSDLKLDTVNTTGKTQIEKFNLLVEKFFKEVDTFDNESQYIAIDKEVVATTNELRLEQKVLTDWRDTPGRIYNPRNPVSVAVFNRCGSIDAARSTMRRFLDHIAARQAEAVELTRRMKLNPREIITISAAKAEVNAKLTANQFKINI